MSIPNWSPNSPEWSKDTYDLLIQHDIKETRNEKLEDLILKSDNFAIKFPVDTGRCKYLKKYVEDTTLERNINSVYPFIHEYALELYCKFIMFKRKFGSNIEKSLYESMTLKEFINRLLTKRAVMFMGRFDSYLLLNGQKGSNKWLTIGTSQETEHLKLERCISYDEIKLSVFLSVSSYTYFVNVGDRKNMAKYAVQREGIADEGIIAGMIGPRLKKDEVMEYQEIIFDPKQNKKSKGYGRNISDSIHKVFSNFYGDECLDYNECIEFKKSLAGNDKRFDILPKDKIFDNHIYFKRLSITFDSLLVEANARAKAKDTTAYIHVVGLGLGVWKVSKHQEKVYMDSFAQRINIIGEKLHNVSDICFSYINQKKCGLYKHGEKFPIKDHPLSGINIYIQKRNPHQKLEGVDSGKLLVVSYAWDGNALPGNEYWSGKLGSSGDSAAASSTQIAEIHNPHINPLVCADNLRIVTNGDVVTLGKYQELVRIKKSKRKIDD